MNIYAWFMIVFCVFGILWAPKLGMSAHDLCELAGKCAAILMLISFLKFSIKNRKGKKKE